MGAVLSRVLTAQVCECTRTHLVIHFIWVNHMVCGLYLNKAVIKRGYMAFKDMKRRAN